MQLISDLHKSEVFTVAKFLDVPQSILEAKPSADLWEGQEDEKELGVTYDFVELLTGHYHTLSESEQDMFCGSLNPDTLEEFLKYKKICEDTHIRNAHKLTGVINL